MSDKKIRISFVCLGNICRSPTAEAIFLKKIREAGLRDRFVVDSAGTGGWHVGERADARTRAAAQKQGIEIESRARQFKAADFARFDYVVAMDRSNRDNLRAMAEDAASHAKIHLFRDFDPASEEGSGVPDPYYEGGFDGVFRICEAACEGLIGELKARHPELLGGR